MKHITFGIALLVAAVLLQLCFPAILPAVLVIGGIGVILAIIGYIFCL